MTSAIRAKRNDGRLRAPADTALIEAGDLLYYDASTNEVHPASNQADQGSEPLNQQLFAQLFVGVSEDRSPSGTTNDISIRADDTVEYEFVCPSLTWDIGDLVGASENAGGTGLEDQQVEKVTNPDEAIGVCVRQETSANTVVRCRLFSRVYGALGLGAGSAGPVVGVNVQTLAATLTLLATSPMYQLLDPGGAGRTVTLPAEAEGLKFVIVNTGDGDEVLTINNDAAGIQETVERHGRVEFVSDGTSWFVADRSAPTLSVNTETLAGTKTIAFGDPQYQRLDPDGSDRDVVLPAEAAAIGLGPYVIFNAADGAETLTVKEDSSTTTLAVLDRGNYCMVWSDGTNWAVLTGNQHGPAAVVQTLAGTLTLNATSALVHVFDPDGAVRKVLMPTEAEAKGRGIYTLFNNATAGVGFAETATVKEDSDTTVLKYLRPGETVQLISDGTSWHIVGETFGNHATLETVTNPGATLSITDAYMPVIKVVTDQNHVLTLPAEGVTNRKFTIDHVSGAHTLEVQDDATATIITDIAATEIGCLTPDATNWIGNVGKDT